jgi:hypothetical protein
MHVLRSAGSQLCMLLLSLLQRCLMCVTLLLLIAAAAAVVPPGYYLPVGGGDITKCATGANGAFKSGWGSAAACTPCGPGIYSSALTAVSVYDPNTDVATPDSVATSSAECCKSGDALVLCACVLQIVLREYLKRKLTLDGMLTPVELVG